MTAADTVIFSSNSLVARAYSTSIARAIRKHVEKLDAKRLRRSEFVLHRPW
jgi:hypothetical protein